MPEENTTQNTETQNTETSKPDLANLVKEHGLQDQLNAMMAENKRTLTKQNQELVNQLESIKSQYNLTAQEKEELQGKIDQLQEQYMSKEELAKRQQDKLQKDYNKQLEDTKQQSEFWRTQYATSTIQRSLQDAALEAEAYPHQIVDMLGSKTQLVEILDEGKSTGKYKPVVKFNDKDGDGNPVTLELTPAEALKRMKELPDLYGNLFKGTATSGLGATGNSNNKAGSITIEDLKDPVKYAKWRKENPDLDLSKVIGS